MKTNFLKSVLFAAISAVFFTSCVNDDDYETPNLECFDKSFTVTKTVAEISALSTATATKYAADDVIEGRVVSSDRGGNFYKIVYMTSLDGQIGFSVAINATDLFLNYEVGRTVKIKLKDQYTQIRNNTLQIGALYNGNVGQLAALDLPKVLARSCEIMVDEEEFVNHLTLADVNNSNIGKLVEFDAVQFATASVGQNYYDPNNTVGPETNHIITDAAGRTLIFRTGSFAEYSGFKVPQNSGKIRGILTKFGSDFQFVARYKEDIKLTDARIGGPIDPTEPTDPNEPTPGAAFVFPGGDFENYTAFTASINSFGIKPYATESTGTGRNGSKSLKINGTTTANDYVFTTNSHSGLPTTYTKIQFYVKGTAAKSLSLNVYKAGGTAFYAFNVEGLTANKTVVAAPTNQYIGAIDTNNEWVLVTLDLTGITDLNTSGTGNFFALKVGSNSAYDLQLDNFTIE